MKRGYVASKESREKKKRGDWKEEKIQGETNERNIKDPGKYVRLNQRRNTQLWGWSVSNSRLRRIAPLRFNFFTCIVAYMHELRHCSRIRDITVVPAAAVSLATFLIVLRCAKRIFRYFFFFRRLYTFANTAYTMNSDSKRCHYSSMTSLHNTKHRCASRNYSLSDNCKILNLIRFLK